MQLRLRHASEKFLISFIEKEKTLRRIPIPLWRNDVINAQSFSYGRITKPHGAGRMNMMKGYPYTKEALRHDNKLPVYDENCRETAFLLGGIGAGNISVGARGDYRDVEIFNHPDKDFQAPYLHFALRFQAPGQAPVGRVLEAQLQPPFALSHGFDSPTTAGLPRFAHSSLSAKYPFVEVKLWDEELPITAKMTAFTPFIPLDEVSSGYPAFQTVYTVTNTGSTPLDITVAGSLPNLAGVKGRNEFGHVQYMGKRKNSFRKGDGFSGVFMECEDICQCDTHYGTLALCTTEANVTYKEKWMGNRWFDGAQEYWDDLMEDGLLRNDMPIEAEAPDGARIGSLAAKVTLQPGESHDFSFYIAWHFPNRVKAWANPASDCGCGPEGCCGEGEENLVKVHYAGLYENAWAVVESLHADIRHLTDMSRKFADAFYGTDLPAYVLDAVASNITVLRSTTCIWLEDGTFMGWEGCFNGCGCCHGSCTHVWNYAQTLAFLFPHLEMNMRKTEFEQETDENGNMAFRTNSVFDKPRWDFHPAADGQMGTLVRLYREWMLTGDDDFLKEVWPKAVSCMEFAFSYWDKDGDNVLDSQQHNTYDIEFYGPNSMVNTLFFAALLAMAKMARHMGDDELAARYEEKYRDGVVKMDKLLWNGEYYIQNIEDVNAYPYQYGKGCLSDQIIGQFMAHVVGLGSILPENHGKVTAESIYKYNFLSDFSDHYNVQRTYVLNDEKGLLLCAWPHGGRPKLPFVYSDEVWTGIEYQVATTMLYEGLVEEGLTLVKAVRERHDGIRRNPFNEVECGHHYARAMASYGVYLALTGFHMEPDGAMAFKPMLTEGDFTCFYCNGREWGTYRRDANGERVTTLHRRG